MLAAVSQNKNALQYASVALQNDPTILAAANAHREAKGVAEAANQFGVFSLKAVVRHGLCSFSTHNVYNSAGNNTYV